MDIRWTNNHLVLSFLVLVSFYFVCLTRAATFDYPIADLSTSWTNGPSLSQSVNFSDGSTVRAILLRGTSGPSFGCGFFCNGNCNSYLFAIFIVQTNRSDHYPFSRIASDDLSVPQVVWSANRNNPVSINATLQLTSDGDLVLRDVDGTIAWRTNTSGKSVAGLNLTDMGNLVLFTDHNSTVWQSFDHPTDSLVPGQKLIAGQKLIPSISETNWSQQNLLSFSVTDDGLFASVESDPPQIYREHRTYVKKMNEEPTYATLQNRSFSLFVNSSEPSEPDIFIQIPEAFSARYVRFHPDGHLRIYEFRNNDGWTDVVDLISNPECFYPTLCGSYGVCSNKQCSCPSTTYFKQIIDRQSDFGCSETTPLTCEASQYHSFLELKDTTYFTFSVDLENVNSESCKMACLNNCSCKAAIFKYDSNSISGSCYFPNQIFSLINVNKEFYNSTVYLKVQNPPKAEATVTQPKKKSKTATILWSSIGSFLGFLLVIGILVLFAWKNRNADEHEEDYVDQVPGMLIRFSYKDLKALTENFSKLLGEGGFGSVFEGTLVNGTKIAVKRLSGLGQVKKSWLRHVKKSFSAEVESIGSIHHVNLVRLLGFCADKSHRLLVYEFMPNGSLDKWIFHQTREFALDWQQRKKIILDIAKGLAYLHGECTQKIIHLDIKPQNVLLDDKFNAKISDFGLSTLIDRDQSKVVTTMRGTPGYMAPEWLSSMITEKVDVYSFGVVLLEILCGRRNIDRSVPEEQMHLQTLFQKKAEEDKLLDLVDNCIEDLQLHQLEITNMMKVVAWCLQREYAMRPSMSVVVKILEGVMEVEHNLDYDLSNPALTETLREVTPLLPSLLSGPR